MCERESRTEVDGVDGGRDESHETECASESSSETVMGIVAIVVRYDILQGSGKAQKSAIGSWTGMSECSWAGYYSNGDRLLA